MSPFKDPFEWEFAIGWEIRRTKINQYSWFIVEDGMHWDIGNNMDFLGVFFIIPDLHRLFWKLQVTTWKSNFLLYYYSGISGCTPL